MTREAFTNVLVRAMEVHGNLSMIKPVVIEIADQNQLTVEYSGSIQRALQYGLVKLNSDGTFHPKDEMTRADAAEQIYHAIAYLKAHQATAASTETLSYTEGVQLID
ncbi:S-layer homology domain-containing protein [Paenibacillus sp. yr247]|uniref:S-layer homology domain-containing protein n=1 Tax=Paenibacillus sp. yr247 TaxID=1761880 RepID=UPI000881525D|nr:S-layer homology domain-containing protein [Paenibacillus sp. yr247]SDP03673.1 S-layer homology domain-containing protein [Paenibacillus sp. yr247]